MGAVSALLGVLYALMEHDLKRLLAYSTVENVGLVFIGVGAGLLFPSLGLTSRAAAGLRGRRSTTRSTTPPSRACSSSARAPSSTRPHTRNMDRLGGLIRGMPWTALCFLLGALAIAGLPPLNGFVSEWLLFQALLRRSSTPTAARRR